jgi:hypothetical protein
VHNVFSNLHGNIIGFNVFSMLWAGASRRKHLPHFLVKRT